MTKTKSQLRAEAIERLRRLPRVPTTGNTIVNAMIEKPIAYMTMQDVCAELIDLLTDDEPANGKKADSLQDTREKLEEDVWRYFHIEWNKDYHVFDDVCNDVKAWLDRQAAITEREVLCHPDERDEQIAELEADNDCLRDRNEKLDYEVRDWKGEAKTQRNNFEQATEARKYWQRKYESVKAESDELAEKARRVDEADSRWEYMRRDLERMTAERDELKRQLDTMRDVAREFRDEWAALQEKVDVLEEENRLMRERLRNIADNDVTVFGMRLDEVRGLKAENAELRDKLSRAYDNAHDIITMVDASGEVVS